MPGAIPLPRISLAPYANLRNLGAGFQTPCAFDLKIVYSYVIEVADSESDLGLLLKALISEIFVFYHFMEYVRDRPGRRGHVHLGRNFLLKFF